MFKPLPANNQTIGDAIRAARQVKNLAPRHIAAKMGIAAALISAWEDGSTLPNEWQLGHLAGVLDLQI